MRNILPLSSGDFASLQKLISETCGLRFEEERCQTLHLALWRRLQKRGYQSFQEYYHFLKYHPEGPLEIRDLIDLITIHETHFFRNKAQFDALTQFVLPEIIARKKRTEDRNIRCWSAGCSTGDEAYSIAIAMLEALPSCQEWSLSILGSDINRNGLAWAKRGIYGEKNISNLPKEYLTRYFKVQGSSYLLHPEIKDMVQFEYHNLAKGPFVDERMIGIDILFCRNVIIYLDVETTRHIIEHFYHCVAPEGYLFLGHAETLWQISNRFEGIEFPYTFIYKKVIPPVQKEAVKPLMTLPEIRLAKLPPSDQPTLPPSLTMATLLVNEAKYKEAADILAKIIAEDSLSVEAYYFLGVLSYKTGDLKEAETQFRKVIYIDPDSALAYFNLGNIYLCQRRIREATREFRNVTRILEKRPKDEQIRFCEDFTADFLLKACGKALMEISRGDK